MPNDRLTPLDASFLHLEDVNQPMHVGCVMVFKGDAPEYKDFVEHVRSRMGMVPRYRQKLATVPMGQGRPRWTDDESFDLEYHVRATALPRPGGDHELKTLAARVFAQNLNRAKPLWEMWLVEGLDGDRFAIVSKTHHAMVDGISGLDILSVLFAPDEESDRREAIDWRAQPAPSSLVLLAEALWERATMPTEALRPIRALLRGPRAAAERIFQTAVSVGAFAWAGMNPAPRTPYNDSIVGYGRRFTWVRSDLEEIKAIKNELGGTVNDVILTVVTRALRTHMLARGKQVDGLTLKAFVPVSVRGDADRGSETLGNQVTGMIAPLPVGCEDARTCLAQISEAMNGLKQSGQAVGAKTLTDMTGFAPPNLIDQAARLQIGQPFVNLVVTNVPGPQFPLHMADRELDGIFPLVPLGNNLNLGVAIVSYNGHVDFGLAADFDAMPDLDDLGEMFAEAIRDMAEAAGTASKPKRKPQPPSEPADLGAARERRFVAAPHIPTPAEVVDTSAERGAEETPGPEIAVDEPWDGYERMKVPEIRERLDGASRAAAGLVEMYERTHKSRARVLEAAERAQRGLPVV